MAHRVKRQPSPDQYRFLVFFAGFGFGGVNPAQNRPDALDQKALGKRFADIIIRAHLEPEHFIDFFIFGGQKNDRHVGGLAQPPQ